MAIIEEYEAIARRLRELQRTSPQRAGNLTNFEQWRSGAQETVRRYIEDRRRQIAGKRLILPRPTD